MVVGNIFCIYILAGRSARREGIFLPPDQSVSCLRLFKIGINTKSIYSNFIPASKLKIEPFKSRLIL